VTPNKYLFNFAVSCTGGGRKRLEQYSKWFACRSGASFVAHPQCASLQSEYQANRYFFVRQSSFDRLVHDCFYLRPILAEIGTPDLYYSYGIPLYERVGRVNWFHVSNALPLHPRGVGLSLIDRLKFGLLGRRIVNALDHADVISAESRSSLRLLPRAQANRHVLSVNGCDEAISALGIADRNPREDTATVVGTYSYKALDDAYLTFEMLRERNPRLRLVVIGDEAHIPSRVRRADGVSVAGRLTSEAVIRHLRSTKHYISTSRIENSSNADVEGVFLADESYLSDIGPHRELLAGEPFERVMVPGVPRGLLHARRTRLSGRNLVSWERVMEDMLGEVGRRFIEGIRHSEGLRCSEIAVY